MSEEIAGGAHLVLPTAGSPGVELGVPTRSMAVHARRGERGMVSAEWAVGILAAIAIAGVLVGVVTDGAVSQAILKFLLWVIETFADFARK